MDMICPKDNFDASKVSKYTIDTQGNYIVNVMGVIWFTNLDHNRRHEPLMLDTMAGNLRYNRRLRKTLIDKYGQTETTLHYPKYDNYDAIEVPYVECIPGDYTGVMGVPISFLDKYDPDQFEILGSQRWDKSDIVLRLYRGDKNSANNDFKTLINGKETYDRIFIRSKKGDNQ